jgi:hypothetical protein
MKKSITFAQQYVEQPFHTSPKLADVFRLGVVYRQ